MMPSRYNIKAWVTYTKQGLRKLCDTLELPVVDKTTSTKAYAPAYAKVPVRNSNLRNNLYSLQRRNYSSWSANTNHFGGASKFQTSIFKNFLNFFSKYAKSFTFGDISVNSTYAQRAFGYRPAYAYANVGRKFASSGIAHRNGIFPSTLYRNFNHTNGRYFSTHSANVTRDAVQNLTAATRAFFNNASGKLNDGINAQSQQNFGQQNSFVPNTTTSAENVQTVVSLIRNDSNEEQNLISSYVDFQIKSPALSMPSLNFLDEDYLETLNNEIADYQAELDLLKKEVQAIFDNYGCLPVRVLKDLGRNGYSIVRIHFPNHDPDLVENLLKDAQVTRGVVYEASADDIIGDRHSESSHSDFMSCEENGNLPFFNVEDGEVDRLPSMPYSLVTDSELTPSDEDMESGSSQAMYNDLFYPVLSSSVMSGSLQIIPDPVAA